MTERVVIKSGGGSPLRVSVSGVDANLAQFNDLLFDANQSPLRLHQTGFVTITNIDPNNLAPAIYSGVPIVPLPGYPIFSVMVRSDNAFGAGVPRPAWRQNQAGGGGVVNPGVFYGINWNRGDTFPNTINRGFLTQINYCIFKNYQP